MPSMQHEILVELFKNRPSLAAELLHEVFDETIPPYEEATVVSANLTEIQPAEYRADLVVTLLHEGVVVFVTVVEVQLAIDPDKRFTWPAYVAVTREEYRCPVDFLVIAPDPSVAKWCEEPIPMGVRRFVLEPPVLRRELVPKVTDSAEARRSPELALLSAMAYGDSTEVEEIGRAALEGFSSLDEKLAAFFTRTCSTMRSQWANSWSRWLHRDIEWPRCEIMVGPMRSHVPAKRNQGRWTMRWTSRQ